MANGLSEMALRVLDVLEESRTENVFAMLNSIVETKGDESEIRALQDALVELAGRDLILMGTVSLHPRRPAKLDKGGSLELIAGLTTLFRFERGDPHWTLSKGDIKTERIPAIFVTEAGLAIGDHLMRTRPYLWWRQA